jgi:integrase
MIRWRGSTCTAYWWVQDPATGKSEQRSKGGFHFEEPARRSRTTGRLGEGRSEGDSAREYLNEVLAKVQKGEWRPDGQLKVVEVVTSWLDAKKRTVRVTTFEQYSQVARDWIIPYIGGTKASALTPAIVNTWEDKLRAKGLSSRTVQMAVSYLKSATRYAAQPKVGLLGRDPLAGVEKPRSTSPKMRFWDPSGSAAFLAATQGARLYPAWLLFLTLGLRRGEVLGLKWDAVDLATGRLSIAATRVVTSAGQAIESTPKTESGKRYIDVGPRVVAVLKSHHATYAAEKLHAGDAYHDDGFVFANELGQPLHPATISDLWDRAIRDLGMRPIRLHDARHSAASAMLSAGVPVTTVSQILGHSTPVITMSVYAHSLPGAGRAAAEGMEAALLGGAMG